MLFSGIYAKAMLVFILLFGSIFYFIGSIFYAIHITDIRETKMPTGNSTKPNTTAD